MTKDFILFAVDLGRLNSHTCGSVFVETNVPLPTRGIISGNFSHRRGQKSSNSCLLEACIFEAPCPRTGGCFFLGFQVTLAILFHFSCMQYLGRADVTTPKQLLMTLGQIFRLVTVTEKNADDTTLNLLATAVTTPNMPEKSQCQKMCCGY